MTDTPCKPLPLPERSVLWSKRDDPWWIGCGGDDASSRMHIKPTANPTDKRPDEQNGGRHNVIAIQRSLVRSPIRTNRHTT